MISIRTLIISPLLKNLLNRVSVPVIVDFVELIPMVPGAEEIPAIEGTVRVKLPADVVAIETTFPEAAFSAEEASLKWSGPSATV